jgi:hypothetical protein
MLSFHFLQSIGWLFLLLSIINLFVVYKERNVKFIIGISLSVIALIIFLFNAAIHL